MTFFGFDVPSTFIKEWRGKVLIACATVQCSVHSKVQFEYGGMERGVGQGREGGEEQRRVVLCSVTLSFTKTLIIKEEPVWRSSKRLVFLHKSQCLWSMFAVQDDRGQRILLARTVGHRSRGLLAVGERSACHLQRLGTQPAKQLSQRGLRGRALRGRQVVWPRLQRAARIHLRSARHQQWVIWSTS